MTKIAIVPNAAGTGTFTIEAPNSNSNRTLTLPDAAGTVLTDVSDLPAANLTGDVAAARITTALNAGGSAPIYACRAWVNFDGTGTVAIRASGNVSSITDNGTGDYTVNFTTAMPDANYAATTNTHGVSISDFSTTTIAPSDTAPSSSALRLATRATNGVRFDCAFVFVAIFR
jgi:hypothetical protein